MFKTYKNSSVFADDVDIWTADRTDKKQQYLFETKVNEALKLLDDLAVGSDIIIKTEKTIY